MGAVTPVRRQDDYGIDLFCTLTERIGPRERVIEYYTVQVKSTDDPWIFDDPDSIRWLIEYPTPLFLCIVSKKHLRVRIYHVSPRFHVWAFRDQLPTTLELTPEEGPIGVCLQWMDGSKFSLSAPIIEAGINDLTDEGRLQSLRATFAQWVQFDRENCDLVRQGLPRFRMPASYTVNELTASIFEAGNAAPKPELLEHGVLRLAEALECIGGLLGARGDRVFALQAALLVVNIQKTHPRLFENDPRWASNRLPGLLGQIVPSALNAALGRKEGEAVYRYAGLEAVEEMIAADPVIQKYLVDGV